MIYFNRVILSFLDLHLDNLYSNIINIFNSIPPYSQYFNSIVLSLIYALAIIGGLFLFALKKNQYKLEKNSEPEFIQDLIQRGLGIIKPFREILRTIKPSLFIVTFVLAVLLAAGTLLFKLPLEAIEVLCVHILFLDVIILLKLSTLLSNIQTRLAQKNNNYLSPYLILKSLNELINYLISKFSLRSFTSNSIKYVLLPLFIAFFWQELFYVTIFFLVGWNVLIYIFNSIKSKPMMSRPKWVSVEYLSGLEVHDLILYQSTAMDYRFKYIDNDDELIIPVTAIKKIVYDYNFELTQWKKLSEYEFEIPYLTSDFATKIINMSYKLTGLNIYKQLALYNCTKIYSKYDQKREAEDCFKDLVQVTDGNVIKFNFESTDFDNIRNEEWFQKNTCN